MPLAQIAAVLSPFYSPDGSTALDGAFRSLIALSFNIIDIVNFTVLLQTTSAFISVAC